MGITQNLHPLSYGGSFTATCYLKSDPSQTDGRKFLLSKPPAHFCPLLLNTQLSIRVILTSLMINIYLGFSLNLDLQENVLCSFLC